LLAAQRQRAADLARQATDLKELITRAEAEIAAAARAAEDARKADEAAKQAAAAAQARGQSRIAALPFQDPSRLAPKVPFGEARGLLPLPVAGKILKEYGAPDGFGGNEKGLSFATRARALVAAPTDGWVAFSGPYRTYGQLLIINAGGGYYVVLAGMDRISVNVGQFVLAGEPVASMGDGSAKTAAAIAIGSAQPILYVEFRKDGAAIDPGPWWAKPELEKVRG
jgi:septal ring factor EnvC (AmiA/AmiB activator)